MQVKEILQKGGKMTIISYLGVLLGYVNLLFLFPKFMSLEQIGLVRVIQDSALIFVPFVILGTRNAFIRFWPGRSDSGRTALFSQMVAITGVSFLIAFLSLQVFHSSVQNIFHIDRPDVMIVTYIGLILFARYLFSLLESYLFVHENFVRSQLVKDVLLRSLFSISVILFGLGYVDFERLLQLIVLSYILTTAYIIAYTIHSEKLKLAFNGLREVSSLLKEFWTYAFYNLLTSSVSILYTRIDILMVASLAGLEQGGIYSVSFMIASVIDVPRKMFVQVALPRISSLVSSSDYDEVDKLYKGLSLNQFIIGGLIMILIWINLPLLFEVIPQGDAFESGRYVALMIGLAKVFDMLTSVNGEIIAMSEKYKFNLYALTTLTAAMIGLNLLLIPRYGINGGAIGTLSAVFLFNTARTIFLKVQYGIQPFSSRIFRALILFVLVFLVSRISAFIPSLIIRTVLANFLVIGGSVFGIYAFDISKEIRAFMTSIWSRSKRT